MPVHPAGPRLYSSIPFKYLAQVKSGGGNSVDVYLNVTPFVDMMTILVTFLLMVFSASGELLSAQRGLILPNATQKDKLKQAPVIIVTGDTITFDGQAVADPNVLQADSSMEWKIPELDERLKAEFNRFKFEGFERLPDNEKEYCRDPKPNPAPGEICLEGLIILQADKETSAKVLNRVIKTAYNANYPNIMFAVNRRNTRQ